MSLTRFEGYRKYITYNGTIATEVPIGGVLEVFSIADNVIIKQLNVIGVSAASGTISVGLYKGSDSLQIIPKYMLDIDATTAITTAAEVKFNATDFPKNEFNPEIITISKSVENILADSSVVAGKLTTGLDRTDSDIWTQNKYIIGLVSTAKIAVNTEIRMTLDYVGVV